MSLPRSLSFRSTTRGTKIRTSPFDFTRTYRNPNLTMPSYIVTLKENASDDALTKAKKNAEEQGGKITHEYTLIKGFSVEYPADKVFPLESNDELHVEQDGEVKTQ